MSFSFGTPSSAPATTGLAGGFNFGANKPATPGFGLTATSQPSTGLFGTPATSTSFGNTSFGASTTPGFGATGGISAAPAFGTTPAFGATSTAPSFGTATPGFGAPAASGFAPATSTTPGFGAIGTPAPGFGANPAPAPGFGVGGLNFGAGTNTSTASTGLNFGQPATSAATGLGGLGGFSFGGTTTQSTGLGFGLSTTTGTTSSLFGKLGTTSVTGSLPSTTATTSLGLGGAAPTSGIGAANAAADAKNEPAKHQKLPNEISTTVNSFKEFVKKQKAMSSEFMRVSVKPLHTVSRDAEATLRETLSLRGAVSRGRAASRRQRAAAAAALAAAEAAARDHAYPGSELEGSAPPVYVKELISELEQQLITFRRQMDIADKQMQSSPKLLTEQELNQGFRRMHESLVGLAARLQAAHAQVEAQKEQYLNFRKYVLKDSTKVFDTPTQTSMLDQILKDVDSSKKKMKPGLDGQGSSVLNNPRTALGGNVSQLAGPTPFNYMGNGLPPFPGQDTSGPTWQPQATPITTQLTSSINTSFGVTPPTDSSFQLQRPPGKRGKQ